MFTDNWNVPIWFNRRCFSISFAATHIICRFEWRQTEFPGGSPFQPINWPVWRILLWLSIVNFAADCGRISGSPEFNMKSFQAFIAEEKQRYSCSLFLLSFLPLISQTTVYITFRRRVETKNGHQLEELAVDEIIQTRDHRVKNHVTNRCRYFRRFRAPTQLCYSTVQRGANTEPSPKNNIRKLRRMKHF